MKWRRATRSSRTFNHLDWTIGRSPWSLVGCHGPFTWGPTVEKAVENAVALEEIAKMATITSVVAPDASRLPDSLRQKHYQRKHGPNAYYGQ